MKGSLAAPHRGTRNRAKGEQPKATATAALRTTLRQAAAMSVINEIACGAGLIVYVSPAVRKRANGEGTIYQRSDGRWSAAYVVVGDRGEKRRRTLYGRTREDVIAKLEAALRARDELQAAAAVGS